MFTMTLNHGTTVRRPAATSGRDQRRLHRAARRHDRLTLSDRLAYWQALQWSRGRVSPGRRLWTRVSVALLIVMVGLTLGVVLI